MARYDVFNGDADGICALAQLHLAEPREATLVTGVKRDISLVDRVQAGEGDVVTVLDVSFDKNRGAVERLLEAGAEVVYIDHHHAGDVPEHPRLRTHINTSADVCTSLLVNGELNNRFRGWAVVGAYGDNLRVSAETIARPMELSAAQLEQLDLLGTCINYNGYGADLEDLHFAPEELFRLVSVYADPFDFVAGEPAHFSRLVDGYRDDMSRAASLQPQGRSSDRAAIFMLPGEAWARRVSGVYGNELTNDHPDRAHAMLTEKADGSYLVSVRAPLKRKAGADELCRAFPTGGGRAAAAGINALPAERAGDFIDAFMARYG